MTPEARARGVCSASGGNHGVALRMPLGGLAAQLLSICPPRATADREARITTWGATVVRHGAAWDDAHEAAVAFSAQHDIPYIHSLKPCLPSSAKVLSDSKC
jgi:threonine dehydratase